MNLHIQQCSSFMLKLLYVYESILNTTSIRWEDSWLSDSYVHELDKCVSVTCCGLALKLAIGRKPQYLIVDMM